MASVTQRIRQIKQPKGGYLNPKRFRCDLLDDGLTLQPTENIHSNLIGLATDYLTKFMLGFPVLEAFAVSRWGALVINVFTGDLRYLELFNELMSNIKGLDDQSIINACKAVGFDVCTRAGIAGYKPVEEINPDKGTVSNIRIMVQRCLRFFEEYGPVVDSGFMFQGGYTDTVNAGDGDYLTYNTLWDIKVSKNEITKDHTLQLLMYYIMGWHSNNGHFKKINKLGIFNPRQNKVYTIDIYSIEDQIIKEVSSDVICYPMQKIDDHLSKYQDQSRVIAKKEDYLITKSEDFKKEENLAKEVDNTYEQIIKKENTSNKLSVNNKSIEKSKNSNLLTKITSLFKIKK